MSLYLDFTKAFDSIPHLKLLIKFWQIGITCLVRQWLKCYLSTRCHSISLSRQYLPAYQLPWVLHKEASLDHFYSLFTSTISMIAPHLLLLCSLLMIQSFLETTHPTLIAFYFKMIWIAYNPGATPSFLCRSLSIHHWPVTKLNLYTSLVRFNLSYSSQLSCPHLLKDLIALE